MTVHLFEVASERFYVFDADEIDPDFACAMLSEYEASATLDCYVGAPELSDLDSDILAFIAEDEESAIICVDEDEVVTRIV